MQRLQTKKGVAGCDVRSWRWRWWWVFWLEDGLTSIKPSAGGRREYDEWIKKRWVGIEQSNRVCGVVGQKDVPTNNASKMGIKMLIREGSLDGTTLLSVTD